MQRECENCRAVYDDAEQTTICPHARFISSVDRDRKDRAFSMAQKPLKFRNLNAGAPLFIQSINQSGFVTFRDHTGVYDPNFFEVIESESGR